MKTTSVSIKMPLAGLVPLVTGMIASSTNNESSTEKGNRSQFEDGLLAWHDLMRLNPTSDDRDETFDPIHNLHYDEVSIYEHDNESYKKYSK